MSKLINFSDEQIEVIQAYADIKLGGNFTMAVKVLCDIGVQYIPSGWEKLPPQTDTPAYINGKESI